VQSILPTPANNVAPNNSLPPNPFNQPPSQFPSQPAANGFDTAQRPQWPGQQ
jgi:hypothetical protein